MVLVRWRAEGLGEDRDAGHRNRKLAAAGAGDAAPATPSRSPRSDRRSAVQRLLTQGVEGGHRLNAARAVLDVAEGQLPLAATANEAASDAHLARALLAGLQVIVLRADRGDLLAVVEAAREGVDPLRPQRLGLSPALSDQAVKTDLIGRAGVGGSDGFSAVVPRLDLHDRGTRRRPWPWAR